MRIAVIGNCTVDTLAACLGALVDADVEAFWAQPSRAEEAQAFREDIDRFDVVLAHPVAAGPFAEEGMRRDARRYLTLPALTFAGFHPDTVVIPGIRGPLGFMHSAIVVAGFLLGLPPRRCARLFNAFVFEALGYQGRFEQERERFLAGARHRGFDLAAAMGTWPTPFAYDIQHPHFEVIRSVALLLPERLGLPARPVDWDDPAVRAATDRTRFNAIWPIYPELARLVGTVPEPVRFRFVLPGREPVELPLGAFVQQCYEIYGGAERDLLLAAAGRERDILSDLLVPQPA